MGHKSLYDDASMQDAGMDGPALRFASDDGPEIKVLHSAASIR